MEKDTYDPPIEAAVRESNSAQEVDASSQGWPWGGLLFLGVVWFCILYFEVINTLLGVRRQLVNATIDPVIFWLASGAVRKIQLIASSLLICVSITRLLRPGGAN